MFYYVVLNVFKPVDLTLTLILQVHFHVLLKMKNVIVTIMRQSFLCFWTFCHFVQVCALHLIGDLYINLFFGVNDTVI